MDFRVLDRIEKYGAALAFLLLLVRMLSAYLREPNVASLVYIFDGLIIIVFILLRRPTANITNKPFDWFVGLVGTLLPLLVAPPDVAKSLVPPLYIALCMLCGTAMHFAAKLRLWRSFGVVAANRGVVGEGIYSLVRHPMYLGYMMVQSGLILAGPEPKNIALILCTWAFFILRIHAEERILSADPGYRAFMARTRFRLLPGVY